MMPDDARISLIRNQASPKEENMEIIRDKESTAPVDERVAVLERKMKELEALVKGLTEELLDLKSITMRLNKVNEDTRRAELRMVKPSAVAAGGAAATGMPKKPAITVGSPRTPPPAPEPEKMDMIMQPDGTLKPEKRKSSDYIVASAGYSRKGKQGQGSGKKSDLIVAAEEDTESSKQK